MCGGYLATTTGRTARLSTSGIPAPRSLAACTGSRKAKLFNPHMFDTPKKPRQVSLLPRLQAIRGVRGGTTNRELDHYVYYCGPAYCYAGGYAGTTRRLLETTSESEVVRGVPEVDIMIREYEAPAYSRTDFKPSCNSFQSAGASKHFTWSQLNGGFADGNPHRPWGIVTDSLRRGLDYIASNYPNFKGIRLTSGYRCPHGNASPTVRGSNTSFHMIGRVADLLRNGWTEEEYEAVKAIVQKAGGTAMLPYSRYRDRHLHMHF